MVKVLDVDWAASDKPILATQDGCLRVMDMSLTTSCSPIVDYEFQGTFSLPRLFKKYRLEINNMAISVPVYCLALLPTEVAFKLRERLCWQPPDAPYTTELTTDHGFTENQVHLINEQLSMINEDQLECLKNPQFETAERCLIVAQLFGDQTEIDLWTVVLYYLQVSKAKTNSRYVPSQVACSI